MKFRFLVSVVGVLALVFATSCGSNNSSSSGSGLLYVVTQGNTSISSYSIDLSTGILSSTGKTVTTGSVPAAFIMTPNGDAAFVANYADSTNAGTTLVGNTISAYTVSSDGTLAAAGSAVPVKLKSTNTVPPMCPPITSPPPTHSQTDPTACPTNPTALAMDASGKFLFVADQSSDTISVFSISGATLTEVTGSPFSTATAQYPAPTGPSAVAVIGNFLYVANQTTNSVTSYPFDSTTGVVNTSQALTYAVGTAPSGLAVAIPVASASSTSVTGSFLYVTNGGSNNVSAFAACAVTSQICTSPNGALSQVTGSPFSTGLKPGYMTVVTVDSTDNYMFVVDNGGAQISGFKIASATGVLTATGTGSVSTGADPRWVAVRFGKTTTTSGTTVTTDYIYVANGGASSVSGYTFDTATGGISVAFQPIIVGDQPSAVAVK